jgi:hypothetical protein
MGALMLLTELAPAHAAPKKGVQIEGTIYTVQEVKSGDAQIVLGFFIVGVNQGTKDAILAAMKDTLDWTPITPFSATMPMFAGKLNQEKIVWLLERDDVDYVEAHGVVHALNKKKKDADL